LKAANILTLGTGDKLELLVTDFSAEDLPPARDLQALGLVLVQLVLRRSMETVDWPVPQSREWAQFGTEGEAWRAYCNLLLDPAFGAQPDSLSAARVVLPKQKKKTRRWAKIAIGTGLGFAALACGFVFFKAEPPPAPVSGEAWEVFCEEYDQWFGYFCSHAGEWRNKAEKNAYLKEQMVKRLDEVRGEKDLKEAFDPRNIIAESGSSKRGDPKSFAPDLPSLSAKELSRVNRAMQAVALVKTAVEGWPEPKEMQKMLSEGGPTGLKLDNAFVPKWGIELPVWLALNVGLSDAWKKLGEHEKYLNAFNNEYVKSASKKTLEEAQKAETLGDLEGLLQEASNNALELSTFLKANPEDLEKERLDAVSIDYRGKSLAVAKEWRLRAEETMLKPKTWLANLSKPVGNRSRVVQTKWEGIKKTALEGVTEATLEANRPRFRELKDQLGRWGALLSRIDEEFPAATLNPDTAQNQTLRVGLQKVAEETREQFLAGLLQNFPQSSANFQANLLEGVEASTSVQKWTATLSKLSKIPEESAKVQTLLANGYGLEEGISAAQTTLQQAGQAEPAAVAAALNLPEIRELLSVVEVMARIATTDTQTLVQTLVQTLGNARVSVALAILAKLEKQACETEAAWKNFKAAADLVSARVKENIRAEERQSLLLKQVSEATTQQWFSVFRRYDPDQMRKMVAIKEQAQLAAAGFTGRDRYNLAVLKAQDALAQGQGFEPATVRTDFLNEVANLSDPGLVAEPAVSTLLAGLKPLTFSADRKASAENSKPIQRGWRLVSEKSVPEQSAFLRWQGRKQLHEMSLVRFQRANGTSFFLASSAVSLGLAADWLEREDVNLPLPAPALSRIPAVWVAAGRSLLPATDWFGPKEAPNFSKANHYPPGFPSQDKQAPNLESPMVYLAAKKADQLAQNMGFRLPTPEEWEAACEQTKSKSEALAHFNFRDATWNAEQRHLKNLLVTTLTPGGRPALIPTLDQLETFAPDSSPGRSKNPLPVHEGDDRFLWFAPVGQGGQTGLMHHLLGNVWQFVKRSEGDFYAVGGSALSEPRAQERPVKVDRTETAYTDVGLRLAIDSDFVEPKEVTELKKLFREAKLSR